MKGFKPTNNLRWALVHNSEIAFGMAGGVDCGINNHTQFLQQEWKCEETGDSEWRFIPVVKA